MFFKLFLIFAIVPVAELYLLIKVGGAIGALNTVLIILSTALLGSYLAKREGFHIIRRIQSALHEGRMPGNELIQGLIILLGGFTLLTPGFITDLIGLTMLLPFTRVLYTKITVNIIRNKIQTGEWKIFS